MIFFQSPPGVKKNLQRTYESWSSEYIGQGSALRAQALFSLAWLHAIVQERRSYIPQVYTQFASYVHNSLCVAFMYIHTYMYACIQYMYVHTYVHTYTAMFFI